MGSRPTVLVDAAALSGPPAGSGIGTYTRQLLDALGATPDVEVTALVGDGVPLPGSVHRRRVHRLAHTGRAELIEHAIRLPYDLWRTPGDVFHNPGFHAPWRVDRPWVQTLLDVIPLVLDDPDLAALRRRWRRFAPRYRRADAIIAISRSAADDGIRLLGLDPARIEVAHLGAAPAFRPGDGPADPPYLLVVSEFAKRKGFAEAFAVTARLAELGHPHRLKAAGRIHDWAKEPLRATLAAAPRADLIDVLGFVDDLPALVRGASVFLMASRYEGFGLPALEAMASGVPVVAFDNSAVTEVVTGGGILVPDGDVEAMAQAAHRLLGSPVAWEEASQAGLARAAQLTWAASAKVHAEVFASVARG
jgi:glycosyltransferase involved in cell wall biosynthesis